MLKYNVKYEGFDEPVSETLYFNLNKQEQLELTDYEPEKWQKTIDKKSNKEKFELVTRLLLKAYGIREGDKFVKSAEISEQWKNSLSYSALLDSILGETTAAELFVKQLLHVQ